MQNPREKMATSVTGISCWLTGSKIKLRLRSPTSVQIQRGQSQCFLKISLAKNHRLRLALCANEGTVPMDVLQKQTEQRDELDSTFFCRWYTHTIIVSLFFMVDIQSVAAREMIPAKSKASCRFFALNFSFTKVSCAYLTRIIHTHKKNYFFFK